MRTTRCGVTFILMFTLVINEDCTRFILNCWFSCKFTDAKYVQFIELVLLCLQTILWFWSITNVFPNWKKIKILERNERKKLSFSFGCGCRRFSIYTRFQLRAISSRNTKTTCFGSEAIVLFLFILNEKWARDFSGTVFCFYRHNRT